MDIKSLLFLNRLYRSGRLLVEETGVPECLSQMLVNSTIPYYTNVEASSWIILRTWSSLPVQLLGQRYNVGFYISKRVINIFASFNSLRSKSKTGWFGIRIMCPSGATCLHTDCCFSELALLKSTQRVGLVKRKPHYNLIEN
jgi:hypothetical protein